MEEMQLTLGNTPEIFAALDNTTIRCLNILCASNDRERKCISEDTSVFRAGFVVRVNRWLVDTDALDGNNFANLDMGKAQHSEVSIHMHKME